MVDRPAVAGGIECDRDYHCDFSDDYSNAPGCISRICPNTRQPQRLISRDAMTINQRWAIDHLTIVFSMIISFYRPW